MLRHYALSVFVRREKHWLILPSGPVTFLTHCAIYSFISSGRTPLPAFIINGGYFMCSCSSALVGGRGGIAMLFVVSRCIKGWKL